MSKKKNKDKQRDSGRPRGLRPFWSGTLSFGLVNVPVHLFPAQRSGRIRMRLVAPDGTPLERRYYCPEHKRDVHSEHLIRGFPLDNGEYVVVSGDELEALEPKKSREIDVRQFVDLKQVSPLYFDRSYFLTPSGDTNKAYRLLAKVLEDSGLAGIATFVMRDKEYLVAILAENGIISAQTLRLEEEIRSPEDVGLPELEKVSSADLKRFVTLIEKDSQEDLKGLDLEDPNVARIEQLVKQKKRAGRGVVRFKEASTEDPPDHAADEERPHVDLLETIRQSLASSNGGGQRDTPKNTTRSANHSNGNMEKLSKDDLYKKAQNLSIEGRSHMTKAELIRAIRGRSA